MMFWKRNNKKLQCSQCEGIHEEWPALVYLSPLQYDELTEEEKNSRATLSGDFCLIQDTPETYRFIRVVLVLPIIDYPELTLEYGLWVSLSEKSFADYQEHFSSGKETGYFGWLCNNIEGYNKTLNIPMDVYASKDGSRPLIAPHQDHDHPLVNDYYLGISKEEAERRVHLVLKNHR